MNRLAVVGIGVGIGVAILALTSSGSGGQTPTGLPQTNRLKLIIPKPDHPINTAQRIGPAVVLIDEHLIPSSNGPGSPNVDVYKAISVEFNTAMAARRKTLPKDANPHNTDAYSKELYYAPSWLFLNPSYLSAQDLKSAVNGVPFDEYGRTKAGNYGGEDQSIWGQTFGGLLKNPLFQYAVLVAVIASGPEGIAIYGAYTMWQNRGQEFSAKNALLVAGKTYAVSQCGPACGAAFDMGVGVASGKSYDKSAEDALYQNMTPEQKVYYSKGKDSMHKMGLV